MGVSACRRADLDREVEQGAEDDGQHLRVLRPQFRLGAPHAGPLQAQRQEPFGEVGADDAHVDAGQEQGAAVADAEDVPVGEQGALDALGSGDDAAHRVGQVRRHVGEVVQGGDPSGRHGRDQVLLVLRGPAQVAAHALDDPHEHPPAGGLARALRAGEERGGDGHGRSEAADQPGDGQALGLRGGEVAQPHQQVDALAVGVLDGQRAVPR